VPTRLVRANGTSWLTTWLGLIDDDQKAAHMVLTACRVWRFEQTGEHTSKTDAGTWALARDPSLTGVERALSARTLLLAPQIAPRVVERVLLRVLTTWPAPRSQDLA
jgi:hypothetical protein